jgi:hypothetical protein
MQGRLKATAAQSPTARVIIWRQGGGFAETDQPGATRQWSGKISRTSDSHQFRGSYMSLFVSCRFFSRSFQRRLGFRKVRTRLISIATLQ